MQLQEIIPLRNSQEFLAITVTWFNCFRIKNVMISKRMVCQDHFPLPTPSSAEFTFWTWVRKKSPGNSVGAISEPTRFSLVRISIRDPVADGKSLVRNSGVGFLVAQCSATPATVAATPPCSATPFQTQILVRHLPGQGGGQGATPKFLEV